VWLGNFFPTFRRTYFFIFKVMSINGLITLKLKAARSFETGDIYPTTRRNEPEDLVRQYENRFAANKILQRCVISTG
jgi:hypothetical protein